MTITRCILVLVTLLALWCDATAQVTAYGRVTEQSTGEVVIGATVAFHRDSLIPGRKPERGAITNKFGMYSVRGLQPGAYVAVVSYVGLRPYVHAVVLRTDTADIRIDVAMEDKGVSAKEVVVTAESQRAAIDQISTVTLTPDFIKEMPSLGGEADVFRVLQLLPGVQSASEISSGLYIRGGSPDQNLILLDGVVVYNPSHLGGFLSAFHADALRDVKLIKGAMPAQYGGRLTSVVDITMKDGNTEGIHGAGSISLIAAGLEIDGPIAEGTTFMVSGRRFYGDLIIGLFADADEAPTYYFYDLNMKVSTHLGTNDRLFISGYFGRDVLGSPTSDNDAFDVHWGNSTANLRWTHIFSPELFFHTSAIYTDYRFGFDAEESRQGEVTARFATSSHINDYTLRSELEWAASSSHMVKSGIDFTYHAFSSGVTGLLIDDLDGLINNESINAIDASLYVQDEWMITDALRTNLGGRLYYFQKGGWLRLEPRLSVAYDVVQNHSLTASFSIAHQFLHLVTRNDLALPTDVWFPSTDIIEPSRSIQGVLGYQTTLADGAYALSAEVYYKSMQNLLEYRDDANFTLGVPLETQFTSGTGEAYGLELFLNKRIGAFTGWIGYTLSWSYRTFADLNNGKTFHPRYDRRHELELTFQYELFDDLRFSATWVYSTGAAYTVPAGQYVTSRLDGDQDNWFGFSPNTTDYYTERNAFRLAPFHKLDLNLIHEITLFGLASELNLSVYNAYNHLNPFALYVTSEFNTDTGEYGRVVKQITLFPIIPSLGLRFKF